MCPVIGLHTSRTDSQESLVLFVHELKWSERFNLEMSFGEDNVRDQEHEQEFRRSESEELT